jgi:hypothetical protein
MIRRRKSGFRIAWFDRRKISVDVAAQDVSVPVAVAAVVQLALQRQKLAL